jgi:GTP-binding protein
MIDLLTLTIRAGDGGHGRVSFRREKYIPKGGPDGGDGGHGGSVIVRVNPKLGTLQHLAGVHEITAPSGENGGRRNKFGAKGEDVVIEVPPGTVLWLEAENGASRSRRLKHDLKWRTPRSEIRHKHYVLEKEGQAIPPREENVIEPVDKTQMVELVTDSPDVILVQGGFGGRGNDAFKSASNTTPLEADYGTWGEHKIVTFELKLLADVGFVGLPNAGKSTMLSRLTNARPKIGNYPFTTLEPHLGILSANTDKGQRELVLADIPGLIEGASEGKGLGIDFLRHLEHCQALVYILALEDVIAAEESISAEEKAEQLWDQYQTLQREINAYGDVLQTKKYIVTINKVELYTEETLTAIKKFFAAQNTEVLLMSAATGFNIPEFIQRVNTMVE